MGKRLKSANYYPRYEALNMHFLGVSWGIHDTRHAMIGIAREFIHPNETFTAVQRAMAASSDHSVAIESSHYAIQYKDIPRLTASFIWEARYVIKEWWAAIGASGIESDYSVPLRSRAALNVEDISCQIIRRVEEKLATSMDAMLGKILPSIIAGVLPGTLSCKFLLSAVITFFVLT